MDFDSLYYPYPSQRRVVFAKNGMVATSQSLAAQAGLEICKWQVEMHLARKTILHLLERKKWFNPPLLFEF